MFSLQTTRLAESFELFNSSLALTMPEFCTHLAMCKQAVYMQMAWINQASKVLKCYDDVTNQVLKNV